MTQSTPQFSNNIAEKSFKFAKALFPDEEWIHTEKNIWVAKSRMSQEIREPDKWEKEMLQVRILTKRGSVAYFLPESDVYNKPNRRYPDMVLDGEKTNEWLPHTKCRTIRKPVICLRKYIA